MHMKYSAGTPGKWAVIAHMWRWIDLPFQASRIKSFVQGSSILFRLCEQGRHPGGKG